MKYQVGFALIIVGGVLDLAGLLLLALEPGGAWWNLGLVAVGATLTGVGAVVAWVAHRHLWRQS